MALSSRRDAMLIERSFKDSLSSSGPELIEYIRRQHRNIALRWSASRGTKPCL